MLVDGYDVRMKDTGEIISHEDELEDAIDVWHRAGGEGSAEIMVVVH